MGVTIRSRTFSLRAITKVNLQPWLTNSILLILKYTINTSPMFLLPHWICCVGFQAKYTCNIICHQLADNFVQTGSWETNITWKAKIWSIFSSTILLLQYHWNIKSSFQIGQSHAKWNQTSIGSPAILLFYIHNIFNSEF